LRGFFGNLMCETTIPRNIRLAEAPSHGKAAMAYDPRSRGSEAYIKLADEIIARGATRAKEETAKEPAPSEVRS
jgi:chromosome partitioning protein